MLRKEGYKKINNPVGSVTSTAQDHLISYRKAK